ncbi:MAG: M14 family metallopeptidase [Minisyncoccia bacterium]
MRVVTVLVFLGVATFVFLNFFTSTPEVLPEKQEEVVVRSTIPKHQVIGTSVEGRAIDAYTYGTGKTHLLFVGGIHGGYEWNSVLLAYVFLDYLDKNPMLLPQNISVTVIPSLNPDGVYKVVGKEGRFAAVDVSTDEEVLALARFNAHGVDLNRNFDCNWKPESKWRSKTVSAGTEPFSEPEAEAFRSFVLANNPTLVVFWHSQSNAVYASECNAGILPGTLDAMNVYAKASKYPAVKSFSAYAITGDSEGWLASINIPAITVELSNHKDIEWQRNFTGTKALLEHYGK